MNLNEIAEKSGFAYIGIRAVDDSLNQGDDLENSYVWIDGEMTTEQLEGACAVNCGFDGFDELKLLDKALKIAKSYTGKLYLVGSNSPDCYAGNDEGEIVMPDAVVICSL